MKNSFEQHNDLDVTESLRRADQPVSVKAERMTAALVRRRKTKTLQNLSWMIAVPAALLIGLGVWIANSSPVPAPSLADVVDPVGELELILSQARDPIADLEIVERQLAIQQLQIAKIEQLKQEIESLNQTQLQQRWLLAREVASRDMFGSFGNITGK